MVVYSYRYHLVKSYGAGGSDTYYIMLYCVEWVRNEIKKCVSLDKTTTHGAIAHQYQNSHEIHTYDNVCQGKYVLEFHTPKQCVPMGLDSGSTLAACRDVIMLVIFLI